MKKITFFIFSLLFFTLPAHADRAMFAGGCFWCMEADFEKLDGVLNVISGYSGGHIKNPTYQQVSQGDSGHYETVEVEFNPKKITYSQLLEYFWRHIDPLDAEGQFCDKGSSYRSAIFTLDDVQEQQARQSREAVTKQLHLHSDKAIATVIQPGGAFYPAEAYHQNYYRINSLKYHYYRWQCGRDARLQELWEKTAP